jgi:crotonobetainyl-CoA:carnitine CoA-transferase CaiB-like acyl-CoA transferase
MQEPHDRLPLEGITVIDLSRALAGPYCSALLADLGARVIKVESGSGDPSRIWPPFEDDHSLYYESTNRNKESIWLNLYEQEGKQVFEELLSQADVLLENYKLGTLGKMGYTAERLEEINAELIHVSVTAFGERGPLSSQPGLDQVVQGAAGMTSVTGPAEGPGYRVGLPIVDLSSGIMAAFTAVSMILGRDRGSKARRASTSLYETAVSLSAFQGQAALSTGVAPSRKGNDHPSITPYGVYETATVPIIIAVSTQKHWKDFCEIIGRPDIETDRRFETGAQRTAHRDELNELLNSTLKHETADSWIDKISAAAIPVGPILDYKQVVDAEQTRALEMIQDVTREDGSPLQVFRGPISIDGKPVTVRKAPPSLSQDAFDILVDAGLDVETIEELIEKGVVLGHAKATV